MQGFLFVTVVLAWGFTWYAIHLQLGATSDIVSIFWRFALAVILLWLGLAATGRLKPVRWRQHGWFVVLGMTLFSCNFMFIYGAEKNVPSGLVSVIFSMATIFNAFNQWVFRGVRPSVRMLLGSLVGIVGVACLFADQINLTAHTAYISGILLALAGAYAFSLGNLASGKATATGVDLPNAIVRGMSWGLCFLAAVILLRGVDFLPHLSASYLVGLAYLSVIGTVVGFLAYLSLIARIGPAKAAYTTVLSPIVALSVSAGLEHLPWRFSMFIGVVLILSGNIIIFMPARIFRLFRHNGAPR